MVDQSACAEKSRTSDLWPDGPVASLHSLSKNNWSDFSDRLPDSFLFSNSVGRSKYLMNFGDIEKGPRGSTGGANASG